MTKTDLVIITILGWHPDMDTWSGLRPFLESIQRTAPTRIDLRSAEYNDREQLREVASNTREGKRVIIIGISFGADKAVDLVSGEHGPVAPIHNLILLDRKPLGDEGDGSNWIQMDDWNFECPAGIEHVANFHGHFGGTMLVPEQEVEGIRSEDLPLYIDHDEFPGHPIVHQFIRTQTQARLKEISNDET